MVATNTLMRLRVQQALRKGKYENVFSTLSIDDVLKKLAALAEHTRSVAAGNLAVAPEELNAVFTPHLTDALVSVVVDAGILHQREDSTVAFHDTFERDMLAAYHATTFLVSEYMEIGSIYDRAVAHLVTLGESAIPALIDGLGDSDGGVRVGCSAALREIGIAALTPLSEAAVGGNALARKAAVEALADPQLRGEVTDLLIGRLRYDDDVGVRWSAAFALEGVATNEAIEALGAALSDEAIVASQAERCLASIDSAEARRLLADHRNDPSPAGSPSQRPSTLSAFWDGPSSVPPRVFLSYPHEHEQVASKVRRLLSDGGFEIWIDSEELRGGEDWELQLGEAVAGSDVVVGLVSRETRGGYQVTELEQAAAAGSLIPCAIDPHVIAERKRLPDLVAALHLVDLTAEEGPLQLYEAAAQRARKIGYTVPPYLRTELGSELRPAEVHKILVQRNFYDTSINTDGKPPYLDLGGLRQSDNGEFVADLATNRTWTRDCYEVVYSKDPLAVATLRVCHEKNAQLLGGHSDWRVPTIEEAMSLMCGVCGDHGLYIDGMFSDEGYVLTGDFFPATRPIVADMHWYALYAIGSCQAVPPPSDNSLRLVRTGYDF